MRDDLASTGRAASPVSTYTQDLVAAARENPVSTALISMGALWMVMGGSTSGLFGGVRSVGRSAANGLDAGRRQVGSGVSSLASAVADVASTGYGAVADRVSGLGAAGGERLDHLASGTRGAGSTAASSAHEGLASVQDQAGSWGTAAASSARRVGSQAADQTGDMFGTLQERFSILLQERPFVVGVMGLALGAGVAAALPRIAVEDALVGPVGSFRDQVRDVVSGSYQRAADEARTQGLTPEAASEALADVRDRVTAVVSSVKEQGKS